MRAFPRKAAGGNALNVAAFLNRAARLWPEQPALALGARTVATYRDMAHQAAALAHALTPSLVLRVKERVNRLLPAPGGVGSRARRGYESASMLAPSWLTTLSDRAAQKNNEIPGSARR